MKFVASPQMIVVPGQKAAFSTGEQGSPGEISFTLTAVQRGKRAKWKWDFRNF